MYALVRSRLRSRSRYSAISLVIESERERTGADADAQVDTLLYSATLPILTRGTIYVGPRLNPITSLAARKKTTIYHNIYKGLATNK